VCKSTTFLEYIYAFGVLKVWKSRLTLYIIISYRAILFLDKAEIKKMAQIRYKTYVRKTQENWED